MYFTDENVSTRFYFDNNNKKAGYIELRTLDKSILKIINQKAVKKRIEYKRGQRFEVEETNEDLSDALFWDYCITAWDNLVDKDGKKEVCNKENKIKYMTNSPKFMRFVSRCLEILNDDLEVLNTKLEKN